jgi:hypothetical protein
MVNMHGAAGCVTVKVLPAVVIVPVRDVVSVPVRDPDPVFAPTLYVTVPLPVPFAPAVTDSYPVLVVAAHVQPALAVTATVPVPATDVV